MGNLDNRFVLNATLDFDMVVKRAIEECENKDREIIVVGKSSQEGVYKRIELEVRKLAPSINISYRISRPEVNLHYTEGSYFIEIDCFEFS